MTAVPPPAVVKPKHTWRNRILVIGGLLIGLCVCVSVVSRGGTPTAAPTSTSRPIASTDAPAAPTATVLPATNTPIPTVAVEPTTTLSAVAATQPVALPPFVEVGSQGVQHFVVIDQEFALDRDALHELGKSICAESSVCTVIFWDSESEAAKSLPMTDAQVNAEVAWYNRNVNTGNDEMLLCNNGSCN